MSNPRRQRKEQYRERLVNNLEKYSSVLLIGVDYVGSNQMQQVRLALRGRAEMLMGKNTVIRRVFKDLMEDGSHQELEAFLPLIRGNVGFIFTNEDLNEIRKVVTENKVPAAAKPGVIAPVDVRIPAGSTGLDPGQTNFFQALNIATKITKGSIELLNEVHICKLNQAVSASAAALLAKLNIKPFFFGIAVTHVMEGGSVYAADILDLSDDDMLGMFFNASRKLSALCIATNYPTLASVVHDFKAAMKKVVAVAIETGCMFEAAEEYKDMVENPDKYGSGGSGAAAGGDSGAGAAAAAVEEEEEEDAAPAADLFGGGDDADY
jgi:large subunit ribosomal protein LP0